MRCRVGITDGDWFETLCGLRPEEVTFWQPSDRPPRTMEAGWTRLMPISTPPLVLRVVRGTFRGGLEGPARPEPVRQHSQRFELADLRLS